MKAIEEIQSGIEAIRREMDRLVIGHAEIKTALLLGLLSREHIYLEGPTGSAKTMLAEIAARTAGLKFFFYQMHRDTRLNELLGELVIQKQSSPEGEIIGQKILKGGILTCQVAVLDDISRAPGEALNILLRILNERQYGRDSIPLLTAIATSNPTLDDYYNEPLDPANLDRFVIQVKSSGILSGGRWDEAQNLLNGYAELLDAPPVKETMPPEFFSRAYDQLGQIKIPDAFIGDYLEFLKELLSRFGGKPEEVLVSDRTFLVKSLKIMRAYALMNGRREVDNRELAALNYLTAFRLPEEQAQDLAQFIDRAAQVKKKSKTSEPEGGSGGPAPEDDPLIGLGKRGAADDSQLLSSLKDLFITRGNKTEEGIDADSRFYRRRASPVGAPPTESLSSRCRDTFADAVQVESEGRVVAHNLEGLLAILSGRIQKRVTEIKEAEDGVPRRYRPMKRLAEACAMHPADFSLWLDSPHPVYPPVLKPEKPAEGGRIAILRDISASMTGHHSLWAETLVCGLVAIARRRRLVIGYLEFNHESYRRSRCGRFFTRDYHGIMKMARSSRAFGRTNYETALNETLAEFPEAGRRDKHIIFITDGMPSTGDLMIREARSTAGRLGVLIHCVFLGAREYPEILKIMARDTDGSLFTASPGRQGVVTLDQVKEKENDPLRAFSHAADIDHFFAHHYLRSIPVR